MTSINHCHQGVYEYVLFKGHQSQRISYSTLGHLSLNPKNTKYFGYDLVENIVYLGETQLI